MTENAAPTETHDPPTVALEQPPEAESAPAETPAAETPPETPPTPADEGFVGF